MTDRDQPIRPDDYRALTPDVPPSALQVPAGRAQEPAGAEPDRRTSARDVAIIGLFVLAVVYTLHVADSLLLPIVIAVLLDFMLSPAVRWLKRFRIPEPFGAGLVVLVLLAGVSFTVYQLSGPASEWLARAPASVERMRHRLDAIRKPVEQMSRAAQRVEQATDVTPNRTPEVTIRGPSLISQVFGGTAALVRNATMVVVLVYLLLAAGDLFLQKLVIVLPQLRDKKKAVQIARATEAQISVYLFTIVLINIGLGVVTGAVLYALDMPNPMLWGAVVGVFNFVPYIGALVNVVVLTLAAFTTFDNTAHALMIPLSFLGLHLTESNLVTPVIVGRRMRLNTAAVFVGLVFWWYIWGITGAIIAVPLVAVLKIVCDHIESLRPFGEFLGEKR